MRTHKKIAAPTPKGILVVYLLGFLIALSDAVSGYVQSSFLGQFFNVNMLGIVLGVCASLTLLVSTIYPRIIKNLGNYSSILVMLFISLSSSLTITLVRNPITTLIAFLIRYISLILLLVNVDIFLENRSSDAKTGSIRSKYLTIINFAWLLSPLIMGKLVGQSDYGEVFLLSFWLLIVAVVLAISYGNLLKPAAAFEPQKVDFKKTIDKVLKKPALSKIFLTALSLQLFYSIAVIYVPIRLNQELGFSWQTIGVIFTIMLLPFLLFQYPTGKLADKYWGEKEMLISSGLILVLSCIMIAATSSTSAGIWALILFLSRVGAAIYESMQEVYFYKQINASEIGLITLFRQTRSAGWLLGALLSSICLQFMSIQNLFYLIAVIISLNIINLIPLKDTK